MYDESRYEFYLISTWLLTILEKIGDCKYLYPDYCEISKQQKLIKANVNYKFFCDNSEYEFCINECNGGWELIYQMADEIIWNLFLFFQEIILCFQTTILQKYKSRIRITDKLIRIIWLKNFIKLLKKGRIKLISTR